jgi:hypothetical protein
MSYKRDGTPISSNSIALGKVSLDLTVSEKERIKMMLSKAVEIHTAVITDILFANDPQNKSKNQVEYNIRIELGPRHGQPYYNVKAINLYGGMVQVAETIYYPRSNPLKGKENKDGLYMFEHDGSQVIVAFLDAMPNKPIILGGWAHTNSSPLLAAKDTDGIRKLEEFNGIRSEINKDGEYILTYFGGQRDTETFKTENETTAPTTIKIDKTGAWSIEDKENQSIKIDRVTKKISIEQYTEVKPTEEYGKYDTSSKGDLINSIILDKAQKSITRKVGTDKIEEKLDGTNEKLTITFKSGMILTIDGAGDKATIVTDGGAKLTVDGNTGEISAQDNGTGKIKIKNSKVGLGSSAAEVVDLIYQIANTLSTDTFAGFGAPATNAATYANIASLANSIKGGI